jgi:hypothetical protein
MAAGWPTKVTYANGDVYSASDVNDTNGTLNYINPTSATDGQVLTRDNASAGKVKWATPAAGMTLLSTTALTGASITVSSINQTYVSLYVLITGVTNATANGGFYFQANAATNLFTGVISFNYNNAANSGTTGFGAESIRTANVNVDRTNADNAFEVFIDNYTSTTQVKPVRSIYQWNTNSASPKAGIYYNGGLWTTSAITSIKVLNDGGNMSTGTMLIYGVK